MTYGAACFERWGSFLERGQRRVVTRSTIGPRFGTVVLFWQWHTNGVWRGHSHFEGCIGPVAYMLWIIVNKRIFCHSQHNEIL